jgi:hypothetical protein
VAGAPFFFGEADGVALGFGVSLGPGDAEADSSGDGVGVGEPLRFFFLLDGLGEDSGDGVGDNFFFFTEADGLEDGVGLSSDFFFGDGDFSGDAVGFGVGDFSAVGFFFVCFRGVGVGVGAKIFLISVPSDCAADARTAKLATIARQTTAVIPSGAKRSRGTPHWSIDLRPGPSTSLRFARDDTLRRASYFFASSARTALFSRIPPSKFSSGKFSFGE